MLNFTKNIVLTVSTLCAAELSAGCDLLCQYEMRRDSLELTFTESLVPFEPVVIYYEFNTVGFEATTYSGNKIKYIDYPGYLGELVVVAVEDEAQASIVHIRDSLTRLARDDPKSQRYFLEGQYFADYETGTEFQIDPSIRFFMENLGYFDHDAVPRLVVSGPFWSEENFGLRPLGLFKTRQDGMVTGFLEFEAKHVLCIRDEGPLDLHSLEQFETPGSTTRKRSISHPINDLVAQDCAAAIQIGPTFFEKTLEGETPPQPGISGLSLRPAKRAVLARLNDGGSIQTLFVFSERLISSFDTMVLVGKLAQEMAGSEETIEWAVGLRDEEFLSGYVTETDDVINSTTVPAGGLLVFE